MRTLALAALLFWPAAAGAAPTFLRELPLGISSSTAQGSIRDYATPQRVFLVSNSSYVYSETTTDGVTFTQEQGVRLSSNTLPALDIKISSITGVTVFPLTGGGYRMLYSVIGSTGDFRVYSATSADGFGWANETGTVVNGGSTFVGFPTVVKLTSGDRRLYYVQNTVAGANTAANHQIYTALSSNEGRNWSAPSLAVAAQAGEVSATKLTSGKIRVYYSAPAAAGASSNTVVASALSSDVNGTSFSVESGVRFSTTSAMASPFVEISTDNFRWRLYYTWLAPSVSTGDVFTATTEAPDPQSIAPSTVFNTSLAPTFTVTGEIFAPTATASLTMGGQPNINGVVTAVDDHTFTVVFNTHQQAPGYWDLVVTNPSGQTATMSRAVLVDFPGGSVQLTDNLFRPLSGQRLKIDVTTYNPGELKVKLYTIDGRFISTLYDAQAPTGTLTLFWDGHTAAGHVASSGVYLVRTIGPKLDNIAKVVLIK